MRHFSLSSKGKDKIFDSMHSTGNGIMICNSAFGMGIDVPNVKFILDYWCPFNVIDCIQESGCVSSKAR